MITYLHKRSWFLSAFSSKRWLNCTPSARLEQNFPNESSVYAEEGTAANALGEYKLRKCLHERVQRPTSEYENEEMEENTDIYAEFIISTVERIKETCQHPLVMVEERLDYSYLVPQGFGTRPHDGLRLVSNMFLNLENIVLNEIKVSETGK